VWGDPGAEVTGLRRLSGGASRETWSIDAARGDGRPVPLILQRDRPGAVRTGGGMGTEVALLRAARAAGVPVADVITAHTDGPTSPLGAPFMVVERLEGETIARRILRDDEFAAGRPRLAAQCGRALAAVHAIPTGAVPGLVEQDQVAQYREVLDTLGEPHPAFELGFRWLDANRPPPTRKAVVHGDFRLGNLMVGPDGLRGVLDWELAHLGDAMEDLGWLCVKAWRFGGAKPVGGVGDYADLYDAYAAAAGVPVDPDVVRWWEVLGTLKWGVMCIMQASSHLLGMSRSVELATIGRRVCENEHDLLLLLPTGSGEHTGSARGPSGPAPLPVGGPSAAGAPAPAVGSPPHDRPTAAELVEAVREYLERDVMSGTEGRLQFHARVAVNALGMVERELALGPAMSEAHAARLAYLGVADEAGLASAIRSGSMDDRYDDVVAAVGDTVRDKLRVANPKYLD
jgi:aminoglycoside phosphotransferase (APT) family kinase protein